jgi:adenylate cyclase
VPLIFAAASLGLAGEAPEARWMIARLADVVPDLSAAAVEETFLYARREDRARVAAGLRAAGLAR